jgi:hypothetical protein
VPGAGWSGERLSNLQKLLGRTLRVIEIRVQSGFRWLLGAVEGAEPHRLMDPDGVAQRAPLVVLGAGLAFAGKVTARTLEVFVADMSA